MEGAERERQEVLERQETKCGRVEGGNRGRKFVVTLSRRGFSGCFEARTSLIRYLKIPKDTYFDPFISNTDVERFVERIVIFIFTIRKGILFVVGV